MIERNLIESSKKIQQLRVIRGELRVTQVEMAQRLGMSQGDFSRLERRQDTLLSSYIALADRLGYDVQLVRRPLPQRKGA